MTNGLQLKALSHYYGHKRALHDVGFCVEKGQFCALLGPNGAGKSTLFALLTRLFTPSSGTIKIADIDLSNNPQKALSQIGVVFQQPTLDGDLTVQQNLNYAAALHGLSGKMAKVKIQQALEQLKMGERAHEKVRALNGGHRRRMEIARALLHEPQLLLLDEATVGLDTQTRRMITDYVHDLTKQRGLTVLWATHLVDEVKKSDQLVVLHQGQIIANDICAAIIGDQTLGDVFARLTEGPKA